MTEQNRKFLLLQINDSLFPIGAYAHSYGLETYIQKELVATAEDAWDFLSSRMRYGFCYNEFLSAKLAYGYAINQDLNKILDLEDLLEAARLPAEIRQAGRKMGSRFVKTVCAIDIPLASDIFAQYLTKRGEKSTTHSVVYGVFCAAAGIPCHESLENYLYAQASSMVTNCVKAIPLSQTGGQRLLFRCHGLFHEIMMCLDGLTESDICLSAPGFDIRCMQHENLYSRIYMS